MSLSTEAEAILADRVRVWEVRRFCQIANNPSRSIARGDADCEPSESARSVQKGDAALSALLRCLVYELDADIAAVTLLDDRTQYFLSVIQRSTLHDPTVTVESSQWYSCASITHRGGLCARTITMTDEPGRDHVFEILDLSARGDTKDLPVVNGSAASFRHYAGTPLKLAAGLNIGTLFIFKNGVAQASLPAAHRYYMCETARHVIDQITQTVEALEAQHVLRCNAVVSSLANVHEPGDQSGVPLAKNVESTSHHYATSPSEIYQGATSLLSEMFGLDSVTIQEVPSSNGNSSPSQPSKAGLLARHSTSETFAPDPISDSTAFELLREFPSGAILHLLVREPDHGVFLATAHGGSKLRKKIRLDLRETLPLAEQVVFLPLRDTFHDRNVAYVLGGTANSTRVLSTKADLSSLVSLGVTIMTQVRRLGAQSLERRKADFLGSISHEMRSPLHGILACLDLLLEENCSPAQLDLLQSAESCGLQLRDNIDNLLHYSNIGSPSPSLTHRKFLRPSRIGSRHIDVRHSRAGSPTGQSFHLLDLVEETIEKDARKVRGFTTSAERVTGLRKVGDGETEMTGDDAQPICGTTITVDVTPSACFSLQSHSRIDLVIDCLLGNCIKFSDSTGCVRVSVGSDSDTTTLFFVDSGRGIADDFMQHNLYVPFAQQDPLDPGTGLGLSLAHSVVKSLGGEISVSANQAQGTEVLVTLPRNRLAENENDLDNSTACGPESTTNNYSSLAIGLFPPTQWADDKDLRKQRSKHSFTESLMRTLKDWLSVDLVNLASPSPQAETIKLDVVIVFQRDLKHFRKETGDAYLSAQKIVLCAESQAQFRPDASQTGNYVSVVGSVCPRKIRTAVASCFEHLGRYSDSTQLDTSASGCTNSAHSRQYKAEEVPAVSVLNQGDSELLSTMEAPVSPPATPSISDELKQLSLVSKDIRTEPRFLLVDDNIINLKVVGAYAKKCSKLPAVSAGGGRQALDAFKHAPLATEGRSAFDIILLDLSMPEVSGFQVAAAVREFERSESASQRTYIAALTGLVSDKDRAAAFAAGVDEYVTKPADLKALQNVVANWRKTGAGGRDD